MSTDQLPETDLVKLAEREVIEAAKAWGNAFTFESSFGATQEEAELLKSIALLTERERQRDQLYDPEHWNEAEGGNPL